MVSMLGLLGKKEKEEGDKDKEIEEIVSMITSIEKEVEEYIDKSVTTVVPGVAKPILMPVIRYCLRAPIVAGLARSRKEYVQEVERCLAAYAGRVISIFRKVIAPRILRGS